MANNLFSGANISVCFQSVTFAAAGITAINTAVIIEVGTPLRSYVPGRGINPITGFTAGKGYFIVMKQAVDLTAYLYPPLVSVVLQLNFSSQFSSEFQ